MPKSWKPHATCIQDRMPQIYHVIYQITETEIVTVDPGKASNISTFTTAVTDHLQKATLTPLCFLVRDGNFSHCCNNSLYSLLCALSRWRCVPQEYAQYRQRHPTQKTLLQEIKTTCGFLECLLVTLSSSKAQKSMLKTILYFNHA